MCWEPAPESGEAPSDRQDRQSIPQNDESERGGILWEWWRTGGVASLIGGGASGDSDIDAGFVAFSIGYTVVFLELDVEYGIGGAGHPADVFGHHAGARLRAHPLGRLVVSGIRISPYAVAGVAADVDWFKYDENGDGVSERTAFGLADFGLGGEVGLAEVGGELTVFVEAGFGLVSGDGEDLDLILSGVEPVATFRGGIRLRGFK